ncbi:MAG: metallopeptidase family protein [Planctomycetota bacterium]
MNHADCGPQCGELAIADDASSPAGVRSAFDRSSERALTVGIGSSDDRLTEHDFQQLIFGEGELDLQREIASVTNAEREQFDRLLEEILAELPDHLHHLLEEVPLIIEDEPSPPMVHRLARSRGQDPRKFGRAMKRQLCGLFTGIPLTERSVHHSGQLNDEIRLFRNGILIAAGYRRAGRHHVVDDAIREQIRITLLHEIGHHFGLDEDDLEALGYG